jgi:hypothetical protein
MGVFQIFQVAKFVVEFAFARCSLKKENPTITVGLPSKPGTSTAEAIDMT